MHAATSFFGSNNDGNRAGGHGGSPSAQPTTPAQSSYDAPYFGSQAPIARTPSTLRHRNMHSGTSGSASVSRSGVLTVDTVPSATVDDGRTSSDLPPAVSHLLCVGSRPLCHAGESMSSNLSRCSRRVFGIPFTSLAAHVLQLL
jgi:hypothetical protein